LGNNYITVGLSVATSRGRS